MKNFRCFENFSINLNSKNIIIGDNGKGKTSIIESIYLCSNYRTINSKTKNIDLLKNKKIKAIIQIDTENKNILEINSNKSIIINGFKSQVIDLVNSVKCVFYLENESYIFFSKPTLRRKFFDQLIFNIDSNYLYLLNNYFRILKNRNSILKSKSNDCLDIWTDYFVDINNKISNKKNNYITELEIYIKYISKIVLGKDINIKIEVKNKLYKREILIKELNIGSTLFGHHLTDYDIYIDGNNIFNLSSNGQKKLYLIIIKLAHLELSNSKYQLTQPIVIDDLSSDLDKNIINKIYSYLSNIKNQVLITNIENIHSDTFSVTNINKN
nr:hypothetical protein [uncultured Desulfuromonas sp.]